MAADTQVTSANRKFRSAKIHRLPCGGLMGSSGNWAHVVKVCRWADSGFKADAAPTFGDEEAGEFECLIVKGDGTVWLLDDDLELMPFTDEFIAVGSGGCYAVAAMHCGLSPADAVRVAAVYDAATSEPVESWQLVKPKAKIRGKARKAV